MARGSAAATVTINAHMDEQTGVTHTLYKARVGEGGPWVTVNVGDGNDRVSLFVRDLTVLTALGDAVERARHDLAGELGLLPNGEPCAFVELFGSLDWDEHDHDACLDQLVDDPVPFVPVLVSGPGTAWERHDDPTVEDNPLDDDDFDDEDDDDYPDDDDMATADHRPGSRLLYAEGWI